MLALSCSPVKMVNVSKEPWTQFDYQTLAKAKVRCKELYSDAPCVSLFRKFEPLMYTVMCGEKNAR